MQSAFEIVDEFERQVARYAGAKYGVAVDSCTSALFLCCVYSRVGTVSIPSRTYCSVPCEIIHSGGRVSFEEREWIGDYRLDTYPIIDSAGRFRKGMFQPGEFRCVSFHWTKIVPIGRGGMILHDDETADRWFRLARFSGRHECDQFSDPGFSMCGWNLYLDPAYAARGLTLLRNTAADNADIRSWQSYPDLRHSPVYTTDNSDLRYGMAATEQWSADGLVFRPVSESDASLVMRWRNMDACFFQEHVITPESHAEFLRNKPPYDHVWIVELTKPATVPVGMASLTERSDHVEYGRLVVDSEFRRRGIAERIEHAIIGYAASRFGKPLRGEYLADNEAVAELHRKIGWKVLGASQRIKGETVRIEYL